MLVLSVFIIAVLGGWAINDHASKLDALRRRVEDLETWLHVDHEGKEG